jgi:HAD superfamily hydrolase (TIGR01509 family)
MSDIQAVFLDLGNVLAFHDDPVLFRRMSAWGGASTEEIRKRMLGLWDSINRGTLAGDELRRTICRVAGSDEPMEAEPFFEMWNCHFRVHRELLPMVDALLDQVKVLLLSNTNEMHWRHVRPLIPQFDRFCDLVISCDLKLAKPDAEIFRVALARAKVAPEHVVYFDDVASFVEAARALGIHGRIFTTAENFRRQMAELGIVV